MGFYKVGEDDVKKIFGIQKIGRTIFTRVSKAVDSENVSKDDIIQLEKKIDEMQENINALLASHNDMLSSINKIINDIR